MRKQAKIAFVSEAREYVEIVFIISDELMQVSRVMIYFLGIYMTGCPFFTSTVATSPLSLPPICETPNLSSYAPSFCRMGTNSLIY